MKLSLSPVAIGAIALSAACSSAGASSPAEGTGDAGSGPADGASGAAAAKPAKASTACAPAPGPSGCQNDASWIRGVARFDPSHFAAGAKPVLRVTLRHKFTYFDGEEAIGGRLHAWKSFPIDDVSKGEVPFALDMCAMGTAMWSEENDAYHLIVSIDENGNNDLDKARSNATAIAAGSVDPGELTKMFELDVSCAQPSTCWEVPLDCVEGKGCTTITPMASCKRRSPACTSDDTFCQ